MLGFTGFRAARQNAAAGTPVGPRRRRLNASSCDPSRLCSNSPRSPLVISLDFVARAENIVFIGATGVGKSGLATGLLLKALQNGYRGLFLKAQDLFDEMYASVADRSSRKLLNRLARVDVLVIHEMDTSTSGLSRPTSSFASCKSATVARPPLSLLMLLPRLRRFFAGPIAAASSRWCRNPGSMASG